MKKLITLALTAALLLGLIACGEASEAAAPRPEDKPSRVNYYNADGALRFSTTYEYDTKGNDIRREQHFADGKVFTYECKNTYNKKGQLVRIEVCINNGDADIITREYNAEGQLIRSTLSTHESGNVTTYTYDNQGQLIQSETENYMDDSTSTSTYEYDAQGLLTRQNSYDGDGQLYGYYIYEYERRPLWKPG